MSTNLPEKQAPTQSFGNLNGYLELPAVGKRLSEKLGLEESKRFKTALASAVSANPKLMECNHTSLISAALIGHSLGLPPSPQLGYYYLVPYKKKTQVGNKWTTVMQAQFQIGYRGYVQLAMRSGFYKKLNVSTIKEGEFSSFNPLTEDLKIEFITDPGEREKAKTVGYCGFFECTNGFTKMTYWTKEQIEAHADTYSKAYSLETDKLFKAGKIPKKDLWKCSSFWYTGFDAMALKTVLRQLLSKWGSMSVDMQTTYEQDVKAENVSFTDAQAKLTAQVAVEAGSTTINAEFEDETPAEDAPTEPVSTFMDDD